MEKSQVIKQEDVLALYISLDNTSHDYLIRSLSEMILKILFLREKPATVLEIRAKLLTVFENSKITTDNIDAALLALEDKGYIKYDKKNHKYSILSSGQESIAASKLISDRLHKAVYDKYFIESGYDFNTIEKWLRELMVLYFQRHYYLWLNENAKINNALPSVDALDNINDIIEESFNKSNIEETARTILKEQFYAFYNNINDKEGTELFMQYGIACFAAQILNATSFANTLNIDKIKEHTFLLDTNVLIILQIDKRNYSESIPDLEIILEELGVSLKYTYETQEEYKRTIGNIGDDIAEIFDRFEKNMDLIAISDDPFIKAAYQKGCRNGNDVRDYYRMLSNVPEKFHSKILLQLLDDKDIHNAIKQASNDDRLKQEIMLCVSKGPSNQWKNRCKNGKSEISLKHDAGLIGVVRYLRSIQSKCLILTDDGCLKRFAAKHPIKDELYAALGIETLISILAVNKGGIQGDAKKFATMYRRIIQADFQFSMATFGREALSYIKSTRLKINEYTTEELSKIATDISRLQQSDAPEHALSAYLAEAEQRLLLKKEALAENDKTTIEEKIVNMNKDIDRLQKMYDEQAEKTRQLEIDNNNKQSIIDNFKIREQEQRQKDFERRVNEEIKCRRKQVKIARWKYIGGFIGCCIITLMLAFWGFIADEWIPNKDNCLFNINDYCISTKFVIIEIVALLTAIGDVFWYKIRIMGNKDILHKDYYSDENAKEAVLKEIELSKRINDYVVEK